MSLLGALIFSIAMFALAFLICWLIMSWLDPKIQRWIDTRSVNRLIASGHWTEEEAREMVSGWRAEREFR